MFQIARDVFSAEGTAVNWLLVREGDALTLVDGGYPGDLGAVIASIHEIGHRPEDVQAILVTHAHVDHVGAVGRFHATYGTPVLMHADEVPNATGADPQSATPADVALRSWRPRVLRWSLGIMRVGATQHPTFDHARPLADCEQIDVPGRPTTVHLPGHTEGSCAYVFGDAGVVATGDALITGHPVSTIRGPQLLPDFFSHDPTGALASLDRLAQVDADTVAPGHGDPWTGSLATAVEQARRTAPRRMP